ncbi:MAG: HAD-IA family hydrolase [Pseudomonadales bacterium]
MTATSPLQAVLFDLDGTLLDTAPDFAIVVNQLRQRYGKTALDYHTIRATVSQGASALITLAFQLQQGDEGFETLRQELLHLYSQHLAVETVLFPGISDVLDWLDRKQLPWGIVTNKPRLYAEPILESLQLNTRCHVLVCPDDVTHTKPNPESLLLACKKIQCAANHTVYLGDHRRDIEAGHNAGMKTIVANYGYIEPNDPTKNWQADFYVDHARDIKPLLALHFTY